MPPELRTDQLWKTVAPVEEAPSDPVEEAFIALIRVHSSALLYPMSHPSVAERLKEAERAFDRLLSDRRQITIKRLEGELVCDKRRMFVGRDAPGTFIQALEQREVPCITVRRGVNAAELGALAEALTLPEDELRLAGGVTGRLSRAGARQVRVDELAVLDDEEDSSEKQLLKLHRSAISIVRGTLQSARAGREIDVTGAGLVIDDMISGIVTDSSTSVGLSSLKGHDEYSFEHSVHAALMSLTFGEALGLKQDELRELGLAAMMHDVGKAHVPNEVLRKPGKLDDAEWEAIQRHPVDGAAILLEHSELPPSAAVVAFEHHMKQDLSGYPRPKYGRDISLFSKIVALMDVYDALTTHRPYRPPMPPNVAIDEMRRMTDGALDARLVEWFSDMLGKYPPGACVELDTGESAVVVKRNAEASDRPDVCVLTEAQSKPLGKPFVAQLTAKGAGGAYPRSIARTMGTGERGIDPNQVLDRWLKGEFTPAED